MKAIIFFGFIAGLILVEGRSLEDRSSFRYEVKRGDPIEKSPPQFKLANLEEEERVNLNELKEKANEQLEILKAIAKQYGFDPDNLKEKAEEQLKKLKEYAKSKGVDFDEMKEKLDVQINKLKDMAKKQGFDVDEMKEKAKDHLDKLIGKAKRLDAEKIKNWINDKYNKVKEQGSKAMGRENSDFFDNLKRKAKDKLRNWFSQVLD